MQKYNTLLLKGNSSIDNEERQKLRCSNLNTALIKENRLCAVQLSCWSKSLVHHLSALLYAFECLFTMPCSVLLANLAAGESKTSLEYSYLGKTKRIQGRSNLCHKSPLIKHEYGTKHKQKSTSSDFDP